VALLLAAQSGARAEAEKSGVVFALYTVQDGVMKMTAQLYPGAEDAGEPVCLDLEEASEWAETAQAAVVMPGHTAHFRVEHWDAARDVRYRVRLGASAYEGRIRRDPVEKDTIVAAVFTGNSPGPGGGRISKRDVVDHVAAIDPDVLLFTGDQVYNHDDHTKWWIDFGEIFGDIIRDRPTVTIPDDHDVGHPNLWGANGRPCERDHDGGYMKPPEYVNMVQRQQTAHLPDPFDPAPVEQGITVYYTRMNVGGIDFAILEDRKFKSGCAGIAAPGLGPRPDHVTVPDYDPAEFDLPGLTLLGERQHVFLDHWARDWDGAVMKAAVSQTVWSMASTHHANGRDFYYADFDANGWPQSARNRAIAVLRRCYAVHLCGDQHLATLVQYGIDGWRDAGWAFCVPSIANLYPRWWAPKTKGLNREAGAQEHTGDYLDGFGNRITVYAHTNPRKNGREPAELHDRMPGFGVARFDKAARTITFECWPRMAGPADPSVGQYTGWPRTIGQFDNDPRPAAAWLPTVRLADEEDAVVTVLSEPDGALVYAVRMQGGVFEPKVFAPGAYTLRVEHGGRERVFTGLRAEPAPGTATLDIAFD
jgi:hypothetical protein